MAYSRISFVRKVIQFSIMARSKILKNATLHFSYANVFVKYVDRLEFHMKMVLNNVHNVYNFFSDGWSLCSIIYLKRSCSYNLN